MNWWHRNVPALGGLFLGGIVGERLADGPEIMTRGPIAMVAIVWLGIDFCWNVVKK